MIELVSVSAPAAVTRIPPADAELEFSVAVTLAMVALDPSFTWIAPPE